jgi:hypothetical protein
VIHAVAGGDMSAAMDVLVASALLIIGPSFIVVAISQVITRRVCSTFVAMPLYVPDAQVTEVGLDGCCALNRVRSRPVRVVASPAPTIVIVPFVVR